MKRADMLMRENLLVTSSLPLKSTKAGSMYIGLKASWDVCLYMIPKKKPDGMEARQQ